MTFALQQVPVPKPAGVFTLNSTGGTNDDARACLSRTGRRRSFETSRPVSWSAGQQAVWRRRPADQCHPAAGNARELVAIRFEPNRRCCLKAGTVSPSPGLSGLSRKRLAGVAERMASVAWLAHRFQPTSAPTVRSIRVGPRHLLVALASHKTDQRDTR